MKPSMFVGSSKEGLPVVDAVAAYLSPTVDVVPWKDPKAFELSGNTLGSLLEKSRDSDYGLFVLTPEDLAQIRGKMSRVSRDNVILELGMFFGAVGRQRCFYMLPTNVKDFHIPTDLDGVTAATYTYVKGGAIQIEKACEKIAATVAKHMASDLSGSWIKSFTVERPNGLETNEAEAVLIALGNTIKGRWDARGRTFGLLATREGPYISGTWRDVREHGYSGAFQLKVSATQNVMQGKWVGWSDTEQKIREGNWTWRRPPQ